MFFVLPKKGTLSRIAVWFFNPTPILCAIFKFNKCFRIIMVAGEAVAEAISLEKPVPSPAGVDNRQRMR